MGIICGIFGMSGDGKSTSTIIAPDGTFDLENYQGMDPKSHVIINLDKKRLPFPGNMWSTEKQNYVETDDIAVIKQWITACAKAPQIKSVSLDTLNLYLTHKEFNDRKKLTFDQLKLNYLQN